MRLHAWMSRPSELLCPNASTTWLNESMSTTSSPTRPRVVYARSSADASTSVSIVRLGSPVSASWVAWCARSSASRSSRRNNMPFSMAIDAWSASVPSRAAEASPNDATALRRDWVTTRAPMTDRSVPVMGAARALTAVMSRSHGGDDASRSTRRGIARGISARMSATCAAWDTSMTSWPPSPSRTRRAGSPSPVDRSSSTAPWARSSLRAAASTDEVISSRSVERTTDDTNS